jgi:peptidoglycan/xylan/chitin deacetylase (PgdA/CDA1 family)
MASISPGTSLAYVMFNDGYRNNYGYALPVLERLGIRSTFSVGTGLLGKSFPTFAGEFSMVTSAEVRIR